MSQGGPVISVAFEAEIAKLQSQMNQAKVVVEKSAKEMGDAVEKQDLAKKFFRREQVIFTLNAIGQAARFVGDSMQAIKAGDWDGVVRSIESLPFGLGQVAQGLHSIIDALDGYAEIEAKSNAMLASQAANLAKKEAASALKEQLADSTELLDLQKQLVEATSEEAKIRIQAGIAITQAEQQSQRQREKAKRSGLTGLDDAFDTDLNARLGLEGAKFRQAEEERKRRETQDRERSRVRDIFSQAAARRERRLDELRSEEERLRASATGSPADLLQTSQTAFGAFVSGNAALAAKTMQEQLNTQKRLVQIAEEQRDILDDLKVINSAGWQ